MVFGTDLAAVGSHNSSTDREADAHIAAATVHRNFLAIQKTRKKLRQAIRGNAATVITDTESCFCAIAMNLQPKILHSPGMIHRILHQVDQHLFDYLVSIRLVLDKPYLQVGLYKVCQELLDELVVDRFLGLVLV